MKDDEIPVESVESHDACAGQCGTEYDAHKGGYKVTVRVKVPKGTRLLDEIMELVEAQGGHMGGIVSGPPADAGFCLRDILLIVKDSTHAEELAGEDQGAASSRGGPTPRPHLPQTTSEARSASFPRGRSAHSTISP